MNNTRLLAIQHTLNKAKQAYSEVEVLMQNNLYGTTINRLYYACFHATRALLLTQNLITKTHKGVVTTLHKEFVHAGLFEKEKANFFSNLMDERIEEDYGDSLIPDKATTESFIQPAKDYIEYIQLLITDYLNEYQQ